MSKLYVRIARYAFVAAIAFLFAWPATAFADSADVVTLNFSGTGSCLPYLGPCGSSTTVTGMYSFDPDASSIVGDWSFLTPFGTFSSTDAGAYALLGESESFPPAQDGVAWPAGYDVLEFLTNNGGVLLGFADPQDFYGPITSSITIGIDTFQFSSVVQANGTIPTAIFNLTSGTSTPVPTPEPSSLLLLIIGLLGLPFLHRRFHWTGRRVC